jgi:hypothetical protein
MKLKGVWQGLLILILASTNGAGAQQQSLLDWLDDPAHDDSLIVERSFSLSLNAVPSPTMFLSNAGDALFFGYDETGGKTTRVLKCAVIPGGKTVDIPLASFPPEAEMRNVEHLASGRRIVHFWEPRQRSLPRSHKAVELDQSCELIGIRDLPVDAKEWEDINRSMDRTGTPMTSAPGSESPARRIDWADGRLTLLTSSLDNESRLYVFREDTLLGIRRVALPPLRPVLFMKSGDHFLIKTMFHVRSAALKTDQPNSPRFPGTATWSLDANEIQTASLLGRSLLIQATRGNRSIFIFYNLPEILNRAAKRYSPDAFADW